MAIGAVIQSRLSSKRCPGKSLALVGGKPLLSHIIDRLLGVKSFAGIAVATSSDVSDDPIEKFCLEKGIPIFRGSLDNVSERMEKAATKAQFDGFVRVNGDSPFIDPALWEEAISLFQAEDCDLVTNVFPRSYPKGQSVEILRTETFSRVLPLMKEREDQEHITRYYYQHSSRFKINNFSSGGHYDNIQLSVDTPVDLIWANDVANRYKENLVNLTWRDLLKEKT